MKLPICSGKFDPMAIEIQVQQLEELFDCVEITEDVKARFAAFLLKEITNDWWVALGLALQIDGIVRWDDLNKSFMDEYFPWTEARKYAGNEVCCKV